MCCQQIRHPGSRRYGWSGHWARAQLVDKYQIQSPSIRRLLTAYLAEKAPQLDYASLVHLATSLCSLFWKDLERHHPGIDSLHLPAEVAVAWKARIKLRHDKHGNPIGKRASPRSQLLKVRAFYQDIARWAAEDPGTWGAWVAPRPIKSSECSLFKETKQRKAVMDQRTRVRLPVLPTLVRTAETQRRITRERLQAVLATPPGQTVHVAGAAFVRIPGQADRVGATDLATATRRDLTYEEERAFWSWAIVEVLRHTGIRVEEMEELTHQSFVAYTLPSTGEVVPMLRVAFGAVESLRRNLACELGPHGIRVLTLQTGGIPESIPEDFDMRGAVTEAIVGQTMLRRAATLEDVGNVAAFAASDRARAMTATAFNITCGSVVD
ncbi:MAG: hypothetical protein V7603_3768 [Micromonosporaceae bacterium]